VGAVDWYLRFVSTVIAAALVYLCLVLTPWPYVDAQTARRPGDPTGPAEMVIVGWRLPNDAALPVQVRGRAEVAVANDVRVSGRVSTEPVPNTSARVVLAGWEDGAARELPGTFRTWNDGQRIALPVVSAR
jgi:hypothetical protein